MHVVRKLFRACAQEHQPHVRKMAEVSSARADTQLVKKPRAASVIWNYFGLKADSKGVVIAEEDQKPVCQMCNKSVPAKGNNTSNLMAHLKEHHPTLYAEAFSAQPASSKGKGTKAKEQDSQSTIETVIKSVSKYSPNSPQVRELNHTVAY